jgi:biopolymer transport protein TolQ
MNNPFLQSIKDSGPVGLGILLLLFFGSIYSWTLIIYKLTLFRQVRRSMEEFFRRFSGARKGAFSLTSPSLSPDLNPAYDVYRAGCDQLARISAGTDRTEDIPPGDWELLSEKMQRTADLGTGYLEKGLIFLATAASTGPLLGILGTVYGVLIAFQGMGRYGSASIDAVAPGISEALITTVFGLIVAIPALVLYNYFQHSLKNLIFQLDNFIADFIDRARREYSPETEKKPPAGPTP